MISHTFGDSCVGKMRKSDSADIVREALWIQSVLFRTFRGEGVDAP